MEYYIKILPKQIIKTFSKYSFDKMSKDGILSYILETKDKYGTSYIHQGYVKCYYGENKERYIVYRNVPNFGNVIGRYKTMQEAVDKVNSIKELENSEFYDKELNI